MLLAPWDYFFTEFNDHTFPDLFTPFWIVSLVALIALVVLYGLRTRALHRHAVYLDMWEWLLWTGVSTFGLMLTAAIFNFDFILVLAITISGLTTLVWVRFVRFPPRLEAYEARLVRQRYFTKAKFSRPEATIRPKGKRSRRRR